MNVISSLSLQCYDKLLRLALFIPKGAKEEGEEKTFIAIKEKMEKNENVEKLRIAERNEIRKRKKWTWEKLRVAKRKEREDRQRKERKKAK